MVGKKKAPAGESKGATRNSQYSDDLAIQRAVTAFQGALAELGVLMLREGQDSEYLRHGRKLTYRRFGGTEYGSYFDVTDLREADVESFEALIDLFGYREEA